MELERRSVCAAAQRSCARALQVARFAVEFRLLGAKKMVRVVVTADEASVSNPVAMPIAPSAFNQDPRVKVTQWPAPPS